MIRLPIRRKIMAIAVTLIALMAITSSDDGSTSSLDVNMLI
jgi:hypothetical protein